MPENEDEQSHAPITRTKAADARIIYIDSTRMAATPWDIRLHFGLLQEMQPGEAVDEEQVVIVMSPQHAKAVLSVLADNVQKWEDEHGVIPPRKNPEEELNNSSEPE